ncbi:sulfur carrier protein ThiS [Alicyclobacillus fodiniaquatilis]|uniref:Sulfur carrier protein ThiS n=1 Tax=Alicyclobacillus fodiniaquatilis TaxID=1661150 RepID=A0ABW4JDZ9_9BACL
MEITVNGKLLQTATDATVAQLIQQLTLGNERIAVEHNARILEPDEWHDVSLAEGDTLEIVRFVGGG